MFVHVTKKIGYNPVIIGQFFDAHALTRYFKNINAIGDTTAAGHDVRIGSEFGRAITPRRKRKVFNHMELKEKHHDGDVITFVRINS
eukprot:15340403-Ditylum_brightwellii.AAC.1